MKKFEISNLERLTIIAYLQELRFFKKAIMDDLEAIPTEILDKKLIDEISRLSSQISALDKDIEHFLNLSVNVIEEI